MPRNDEAEDVNGEVLMGRLLNVYMSVDSVARKNE
jgi:hypothetical protein